MKDKIDVKCLCGKDLTKEKGFILSERECKGGKIGIIELFTRLKYIEKEFIKRRAERIKLIIKLYPHKKGEELAGELIEDLFKDAGDKLT